MATEGTTKITSGLGLTKNEVREYYARPEIQRKLLSYIRGKDLLVGQSAGPGEVIYRRYQSGRPITINSPKDLEYYGSRRYTEFHPVIGKTTKEVWVDLDPGKGIQEKDLKETTRMVDHMLKSMPEIQRTSVTYSGGRGYYVRGLLAKEMDTSKARDLLQKHLSVMEGKDKLFTGGGVTFRPPGSTQIRLDLSTLHDKGSIRAPYALHSETGLMSVPVRVKDLPDFNPQRDANPRKLAAAENVKETFPGIPEHILQEALKDPWITDPAPDILTADSPPVPITSEGEVVGFHLPARTAEGLPTTGDIYITPEHRSKGLGSAALKQYLSEHPDAMSFVHKDNAASIRAHQKAGFENTELCGKNNQDSRIWKAAPTKTAAKEFAPGIPISRTVHDLPELSDKTWTMAIQLHNAERAGKHWDLRLVDPNTTHAHSWAVPKAKLPSPGEPPILAVRTPTHTARYALSFGIKGPKEIREGYGKGLVEMIHKEPVTVLSSKPDKIKFERKINGLPQQFVLFQAKGPSWMIKNITKSSKEASMGPFQHGQYAAFRKLGLAGESVDRPSTLEAPMPLDTQDDNLPAGQIAAALSQLPDVLTHSDAMSAKGENVEGHLNRNTVWSEPHPISNEMATGPSPIMPGRF